MSTKTPTDRRLRRRNNTNTTTQSLLIALLSVTVTFDSASAQLPSPNAIDYDVPTAEVRVNRMRQVRRGARQDLDALDQQLARAQARVDRQRNSVQAVRAQIATKEQRIQQIQQRIAQQEQALRQAEQAVRRQSATRRQLNQQLRAAQASVAQINRQNPNLETRIRELRAGKQVKERAVQTAQAAQTATQTAYDAKQEELQRLDGRIALLQQQKQNLERRLARIGNGRPNSANQARIRALRQQIAARNTQIQTKQTEITQTNQELTQARTRLAQARRRGRQAAISRIQGRVSRLERQLQTQTGEKQQLERLQTSANRELAQLQRAPRGGGNAAQLRRQIAALQTQITEAQGQKRTLEPQVRAANTRLTGANRTLATARQQLVQARRTLQAARQKLQRRNAAQQTVTQTQTRLQQMTRDLAGAERTVREAPTQLQQKRQRIARLEGEIAPLKNALYGRRVVARRPGRGNGQGNRRGNGRGRGGDDGVRRGGGGRNGGGRGGNGGGRVERRATPNSLIGILRRLRGERNVLRDQRPRLAQNFEQAIANHRAARQRLAQVQDNLQRGLQIAHAEGASDGQTDGLTEGARLGRIDGRNSGNEEGGRLGAADAGASNGAVIGEQEGAQQAENQGRTDGNRIGREEGRQAGLERGRAQGSQEGRNRVLRQGTRHASYRQGRRAGEATGRQRANDEAVATSRPAGYEEVRQERLNAQLNDVALPNQTGGSSLFNPPRWDNYNPRRSYPYPALNGAYGNSYQAAFQQAASAAYAQTERAVREEVRANQRTRVQQAYSRPGYRDAYHAYYERSFNDAKTSARTARFNELYDGIKEQYRQAAATRYADDLFAQGRTEGRRAGQQEAENELAEQGRREGDAAAYGQRLPQAQAEQNRLGRAEATRFFDQNAVLEVEGAVVSDANGDSIAAPGEELLVSVTVKNFGGTASTSGDLQVLFSQATQGLEISRNSVALTSVPGQSRAVITGITGLELKNSATPGSRESVQLQITKSGQNVFNQRLAALTVNYPYAVTDLNAPQFAGPGAENTVDVSIRNVSSRASASDITIELESTDTRVEILNGTAAVGQLQANQTVQGQVSFRVGSETLYDQVTLIVTIKESGRVVGRREFTTQPRVRYVHNATAGGLLVVSGAAAGRAASAALTEAGLTYDVYDEEVMGALRPQVADQYLNRRVIAPDVSRGISAATVQTLHRMIDLEGKLFVGASGGVRGTELGRLAGRLTRAFRRTNTPRLELNGVNLYSRNQHVAQDPGFMIAIGRDATTIAPHALAESYLAFHLATSGIEEVASAMVRFSAAQGAPKRLVAQNTVVKILAREMKNEKELNGGQNYEQNAQNTLLGRFVNLVSTRPEAEQRVLVLTYPGVEQARRAFGGGLFNHFPGKVERVLLPLKRLHERLTGTRI